MNEFNKNEGNELFNLITLLKKGLKTLFNIETTYIFQDDNSPHFHIWVFPQLGWMNEIGIGIQSIPKIIKESYKRLHQNDNVIIERAYIMKNFISSAYVI